MQNFFKKPITSRISNQKLLVLINPTPNIFNRPYSGIASSAAQHTNPRILRNEALKKYGLSHLDLRWPESVDPPNEVDSIQKNAQSISQVYGEADLSKLPIFQGGFINLGYWPNSIPDSKEITVEQRIAYSKEMYRLVGDLVEVVKGHNVLDVGCGLAYGSSFLSQRYEPKLVVGLDASPDQIARARKHQAAGLKAGKLCLSLGEAEYMPFAENSFDCVVSVEAAQHFLPMNAFLKELPRVLKPGGKFVMASFFPTTQEGVEALNAIVPNYHLHGSQNTVKEVEEELAKHMESVKISNIGENVWHGFSKWLDQVGYNNQWQKIWGALYEKGLIDYVVYQANAPKIRMSEKENFKFSL